MIEDKVKLLSYEVIAAGKSEPIPEYQVVTPEIQNRTGHHFGVKFLVLQYCLVIRYEPVVPI